MPLLPERPNIEHLKTQAKDLLRLYDNGDADAFARFRNSLPAAANKSDTEIAALGFKLHDAQSCIACEYGLPSWRNLRNYVDWRSMMASSDRKDAVPRWLNYVYGHETDRARPALAARILAERPEIGRGELFLACASGDIQAVERAVASDRAAVNRLTNNWRCPGCKEMLDMPPLVAVTHSGLLQAAAYRDRLHRCARILLDAGADPNQSWMHGQYPLSALFGAAGKNHDPELTKMLLEAGANPNDNESLYHSLEGPDLACTRLLLEAGERVEGTNAIHHELDRDRIEGLELLLAHTRDVNDLQSNLGGPLIWAIRRRRSRRHIEALLAAGADARPLTNHGVSLYRMALLYGLPEAARLFQPEAQVDRLPIEDRFVAACTCCDEAEARRILADAPDIFRRLSETHLRQLPNMIEGGNHAAARLMVELGWPIAVEGGDWKATALNLAVFQGNSELARFLLEHGASWTEKHGHGDNVNGTLSWASRIMIRSKAIGPAAPGRLSNMACRPIWKAVTPRKSLNFSPANGRDDCNRNSALATAGSGPFIFSGGMIVAGGADSWPIAYSAGVQYYVAFRWDLEAFLR